MSYRSPVIKEGEGIPGRENGKYKGTYACFEKDKKSLVDFQAIVCVYSRRPGRNVEFDVWSLRYG